MDSNRFDHVARAVATSGSRRHLLGGLLMGALVSLKSRITAADDSGTAIADASGGNHNHATAADPATGGNDRARDHDTEDGDRDDNRDAKDGNRGDQNDAGSAPDAQCLCATGTCYGAGEQCCPRRDPQDEETQIGSTCCVSSTTACACGDCVEFCPLDEPFASVCDCICPPQTVHCTLVDQRDRPNTCCTTDQECCVVGSGVTAVNRCCPEGTCIVGVGCGP